MKVLKHRRQTRRLRLQQLERRNLLAVGDVLSLGQDALVSAEGEEVDETPPVPVLVGPASPTNQDPFEVALSFGEPVIGFSSSDITVLNGALVDTVDQDNGNFLLIIDAAADGDVQIEVTGRVADLAGNLNVPGDPITVTVDTTPRNDFGDAPAPYPTTLADDGARHLVGSLHLGINIDADTTAKVSPAADGDDDDGIRFVTSLPAAGGNAISSVALDASDAGFVDAWIDFNADGDWSDDGEQIFTSVAVNAGSNILGFPIPVGTVSGETFARFRFSSTGGLAVTGAADDGEVEDYLVSLLSSGQQQSVQFTGDPLTLSFGDGKLVVDSPSVRRLLVEPSFAGSLFIEGTADDDLLTLDLNQPIVFPKDGIVFRGGAGANHLRLIGNTEAFDLRQPSLVMQRLARVDLSASDATGIIVDAALVGRAAATNKQLEVLLGAEDQLSVADATEWRMTTPVVRNDVFWTAAVHQGTEGEQLLVSSPRPWQNFLQASDVNNDGSVSALDALNVINELARQQFIGEGGVLKDPSETSPWPGRYFDQNGDNRASALDALRVINELASQSGGTSGEQITEDSVELQLPPSSLTPTSESQQDAAAPAKSASEFQATEKITDTDLNLADASPASSPSSENLKNETSEEIATLDEAIIQLMDSSRR